MNLRMIRKTDKELLLGLHGEKYVGEYKDDDEHGQGIWTDSDGHTYARRMEGWSKEHGHGTKTWQNPWEQYVGEYKYGKSKRTWNLHNGRWNSLAKVYGKYGESYFQENKTID